MEVTPTRSALLKALDDLDRAQNEWMLGNANGDRPRMKQALEAELLASRDVEKTLLNATASDTEGLQPRIKRAIASALARPDADEEPEPSESDFRDMAEAQALQGKDRQDIQESLKAQGLADMKLSEALAEDSIRIFGADSPMRRAQAKEKKKRHGEIMYSIVGGTSYKKKKPKVPL